MSSSSGTPRLHRARGQLVSRGLSCVSIRRHVFRRSRMMLLMPATVAMVMWSLHLFLLHFKGEHGGSGRMSEILSRHEIDKRNLSFSQGFLGRTQDEEVIFNANQNRKHHFLHGVGVNVSLEKSGRGVNYFAADETEVDRGKALDKNPLLPAQAASERLAGFWLEGRYLQQEVNESYARRLVADRGHNSTSGQLSPIQEDLVNFSDPEVKARLNLLMWKRPRLLPSFKNPCWQERGHLSSTCRKLPVRTRGRHHGASLRCLPYFFLIGQPKCGTSDIFFRLALHPQVAHPPRKEIFWLDKRRFEKGCVHINSYLNFLGPAVRKIAAVSVRAGDRFVHPLVTGDGTPDVMWDNHEWWRLPGNEGCQEPCLTNADLLHHLQPDAKLIVAFRHPADRLYSDYLYESDFLDYQPSPQHFHQEVLRELDVFRGCLLQNPLRACVYNGSQENYRISKVRLRIGLYSVHLEDWLRVFPRSQLHVIRFEDYVRDLWGHLHFLYTFLDLSPLPPRLMTYIVRHRPVNQRPSRARALGDMFPATRAALREFYQPYNQRLAELLGNPAFLWQDTPPPVT